MKQQHILMFAVGLVVIVILAYNLFDSDEQAAKGSKSYIEKIEKKRQSTDDFMRNDEESPFVRGNIAYSGLNYFPIDERYKVEAELTHALMPEGIKIKMSQGEAKTYYKQAYAKFTLLGKSHRLVLLQEQPSDPYFFVMFTDETSGKSSYGAGRYLDIPLAPGPKPRKVTLDFNLAYNPYCAYNDNYTCPKPPAENHLEIAIEAGEQSP